MQANMGGIDRVVRVVVAVAVAALILAGQVTGWLAIVLGVVAVVFVLTSVVAFCPLYTLLGIRTCPRPAGTQPK